MNKIWIVIYFIASNLLVFLSSYFSYLNKPYGVWHINIRFVLPVLLFFIITALLFHKKMNTIAISDIILFFCLYLLSGIILIVAPYFLPDILGTYVASSVIVSFGGICPCLLVMLFDKKFKNKKVLKVLKYLTYVLVLCTYTASVINCFTPIIENRWQ